MRHPLPFSPGYEFMATRVLALNGRAYQAGDTIDKTGLSVSRLRQLYEGRKIAPLIPEAEANLFNHGKGAVPVKEPAKEPAIDPVVEVAKDAPAVAEEPEEKPAKQPAKPKRKA